MPKNITSANEAWKDTYRASSRRGSVDRVFSYLGLSCLVRSNPHFPVFWPFFFYPENALLLLSYLLVVPVIALFTYPLYKLKGLTKEERLKAVMFIALPGMFIDTVVLVIFPDVFTNLPVQSDRYFGSWLLWAYSLILITGLPLKKQEGGDK